VWRKLAEVVEKYVHTGDKLYIEGEIRTRSYTDKQGRTHNITEIWANNLEMLSSKPQTQQQEQTTPAAPEKCPF
jgi:single-strand DNA-binding protein